MEEPEKNSIPLNDEERQKSSIPVHDEEKQKNSILIVDDEKLNLKALTQILQPDYKIYTAKDGSTAINMAEQFMPDLILLDILMPEMDGYEVLEILKKKEKTKEIPIVFISGLNNAWDEEKGLALGTVDYIAKPFSAAIVKLRVMNQIKIVNQIHAIEHLTVTDQLTNLANRRSFDSVMLSEWKRAAKDRSPLTLLMIDIDKFKNYNDKYGHLQGDVLLQKIARIFTETLKRKSDLAARWGGEEFVILLPGTDSRGAEIVAEKIRRSVENAVIPLKDGSETKTTISLGANTKIPGADDSIDSFVSGADEALYTAKKTGRNRFCVFENQISEP